MTATLRDALLGLLILTSALALSLLAGIPKEAQAATTPAGFTDERVVAVGAPTALAFTPDGRMLVSSQGGQLRVYRGSTTLKDPALNLGTRVCAESERGLLGVAVDPQFATNKYVYLYYTANRAGTCVNRVSRFVLGDDNVVALSSEKLLVDGMPSPAGNHNAGDVHFGKDGYLYASVGDGGCDYAGNSGCAGANDAAQDPHALQGKILRVDREGNPAPNGGQDRCGEPGGDGRTIVGPAPRFSPPGFATPSGSPWTRTPRGPASSSTTSDRAPTRRSTRASGIAPAPTTAGISVRAAATTPIGPAPSPAAPPTRSPSTTTGAASAPP